MKSIKKTENLTSQVFEQLKDQIITGKWKPGYKIPSENELAEIFNVSRMTVREALQALVALDLLEKKRGRGTFVKNSFTESFISSLLPLIQFDRSQAAYMHEYRKIVEVGSIELVVERASLEDIQRLKNILEEMKKYRQNNLEKFALEDVNFHLALSQITKNPIIIRANFVIKDFFRNHMIKIVEAMGTESGLYFHEKIIQAIEKGNKEEAKQLMKKHLEKNEEYLQLCS
ncbi:MAG: FadR/GntR family transcriptional regulator [Atribacterota bacterium]|nr:FadR/GntR family transcriptional regulator [Atribacterota bacterium]